MRAISYLSYAEDLAMFLNEVVLKELARTDSAEREVKNLYEYHSRS